MKSDNICNLGFGAIESYDLAKTLKGCNEAYILGVTIGIGADRLIVIMPYAPFCSYTINSIFRYSFSFIFILTISQTFR